MNHVPSEHTVNWAPSVVQSTVPAVVFQTLVLAAVVVFQCQVCEVPKAISEGHSVEFVGLHEVYVCATTCVAASKRLASLKNRDILRPRDGLVSWVCPVSLSLATNARRNI